MSDTPVIETCELGHKFAKLSGHPKKDGISLCPYCAAVGLETARAELQRLLAAVLQRLLAAVANEGTETKAANGGEDS